MRKLVNYTEKEYGRKVANLVSIDEETKEIKERKAEHRKKIAEKFGIRG